MTPEEAPCLVTAWKALSDMLPVNKCELVCSKCQDWKILTPFWFLFSSCRFGFELGPNEWCLACVRRCHADQTVGHAQGDENCGK